jgi:hypothetical protein
MRLARHLFAALAVAGFAADATAAGPEKVWELGGFKTPESVLPATSGDVLFVSNIDGAVLTKDGNGYLSKISPDGKMITAEWVKGFNAPKGLGQVGGTLYVADIDELVAVDIAKGEITKRYPAKDAVFLNDVATDSKGRVFVSDTGTNTIWVLDNGDFSVWLKDPKLKSPNGLLIEGDKLIVAGFGSLPDDKQAGNPAHLLQVSLADKAIRSLGDATPVGHLDGLEPLGGGDYVVTDWFQGVLYRIHASGRFEKLLDFGQGSADLAYIPATKTAIIPLMLENKVVAYKLG